MGFEQSGANNGPRGVDSFTKAFSSVESPETTYEKMMAVARALGKTALAKLEVLVGPGQGSAAFEYSPPIGRETRALEDNERNHPALAESEEYLKEMRKANRGIGATAAGFLVMGLAATPQIRELMSSLPISADNIKEGAAIATLGVGVFALALLQGANAMARDLINRAEEVKQSENLKDGNDLS